MINKKLKKNKPEKKLSLFKIALFILLLLFYLFYPGDSYYIELFFYNRKLLAEQRQALIYKPDKIPYVRYPWIVPQISAQGVYIIDLNTATPVYEKNIDQKLLPASTTKIITALTAIDYYKSEDILTVKRNFEEGQIVGLYPDEKLTFENLIYGLLIHSGNDVAYVIADNYPGGEKKFVAAMNKKAQQLGMKNTQLKNPAGLDDFGQHTTPFDLSLAARQLMRIPLLAKTVAIKNITISDVDFEHFHPLSNVNRLLGEIPGIGGLKTGYTMDAGENLVSFYKKNGYQYIIIVLKSEDRFSDTKNIVDWINSNVDYINPDELL